MTSQFHRLTAFSRATVAGHSVITTDGDVFDGPAVTGLSTLEDRSPDDE